MLALFYFWQGITLGFPAAVTPGPLQAFYLSQTMRNGWQRTLPATFAPLLSDGPIIALVILLLTQLPPTALYILQLIGGIYLLYLAWGTYRSYRNYRSSEERAKQAVSAGIFKATLINLLNPNPYIFWGTVGGVKLLQAWRVAAANGIAFLSGFYVMLIGGFSVMVLLFGLMRSKGDGRTSRLLLLLAALALIVFAVAFQIVPALIGLF